MEWQEPAIILEVLPYGEGDALVTLLTAGQGAWRGLAKGGAARAKVATWQPGNLVAARWVARLADQFGSVSAELVHPAAALAMADRLSLAVLNAACAVATGALPEREPHPECFAGLARLLAGIDIEAIALPALVAWEVALLRELGFGLDLGARAIAGDNDRLEYVSPRTGRAVSLSAAGDWAHRLLRLPGFLLHDAEPRAAQPSATQPSLAQPSLAQPSLAQPGLAQPSLAQPSLADCLDGLRLTGHFLARDAFGARHRPLPPARERLYDLVAQLLGATGA